MRDEEVRNIGSDMSSKKNISPIKNSSTEKLKHRSPNDDIMNSFIDLGDRSSPPIERFFNEESNWHQEAEQFTPAEGRISPRNKGMNFNVAEVKSIGNSDGESSDPLLLGY